MSVTIDSLDIQIRSSAGSAAANIDRLAESLGKLRENAKLNVVANNLTKLSEALGKLQGTSTGLSNIRGLAGAMKSLSQVEKSSGLNSTLNSLKKLPDIVNQLDASTLSAFSAKMRELAAALAPLSTQLDSVSRSFAKLPARISQIVTGTNKMAKASRDAANAQDEHNEKLNVSRLNMAAWITSAQGLIQGAQGVIQAIQKTMADAIEWDGIQYRFGRAFGEDAEEVLAYAEKLSEVLKINQQQFMQYSSMFGSLLSGFGMEQDKITDISVGLTELSYDIWAAYNDRYKTYEEAFEAVRSAITGEIEPIRNAGIALTEASMQEYLDSIGMAHVSIEKLTEAQKSEVRYAVMVNSAMSQGIVGTYAKEMDTAEGAIRSLTQQFKTLAQAFGSLFIPILQVAVPWITAFVEILTDAVFWLGNLFGIDMQKISWGDTTKGVDGLAQGAEDANAALDGAKDAAKKLKSYTMGFDELNVINPGSDAASGGAGAGADGGWGSGLDLDRLWDESVFENASKKVSEIKEKILEWKVPILIALGLLGTAGMISLLGTIVSKIVDITNLFRAFTGAVSGSNAAMSALSFLSPKWANVASVITGIGAKISGLAGGFKAAMGVVGSFVSGLTAGPILLVVGIIAAIASVVIFLKRNWEEVTNAVKGFFETNIAPKLDSIKESWQRMKDAVSSMLPPAVLEWFKGVGEWIGNIIEKIAEFVKSGKILEGIGKAFEVVGGVIFGVVSTVIAGAISALVGMIDGLIQTFSGVIQVVTGVVEFFVALFTGGDLEKPIKQIADGIVNIFVGLYKATIGVIVDFVKGIIDWFTELWDELVGHSIVPDMVKAIIDWFLSLPGKILQPIKDFCSKVKQAFSDLWTGVKEWWSANVAPKFTLKFWVDVFKNVKEGFTQSIKNAVNAGIDLMNRFIGWLNEKLHFSWDALTIMGKEVFPAGSIQLFTIPTIPRLENGGFLEDGLFTMNHGEIAGKFSNGQSVVANNQQIVEGIAAGVYEAVVAAMNATNGRQDQNVNVYLDGKQIYASVKKTESERGRTLMGNQLGYVY